MPPGSLMRVGFAIPAFLPARGYGGPVETVLGLAAATRALGVEAEVYTSTLAARGTRSLAVGDGEEAGLAVHRLPTVFALGWAPVVRWQAPGRLPDVLHVLGAWNGLSYAAATWAAWRRIPWIWEPCGMLAPRGRRRAAKVLFTPYHLALARLASGVVWKSPQELAEAPALLRHGRGFVRPNAVERPPADLPPRAEARRRLGLPVDGPLWGYLGRLAHRKGIPALLELWRQAAGPGTLALAGPGEDADVVLLAEAARAARVVRLGPQDRDQRWLFLRALDALVLLPTYGENFGNVVAEAVAAGTPAVLSPAVGAGHWLAGRGAVVVAPPFAELRAMLARGEPPRLVATLPPELDPAAIGRAQLDIWRAVLGERAGR
jgi:glycosyltransferase involved in cell wall biosynthesis